MQYLPPKRLWSGNSLEVCPFWATVETWQCNMTYTVEEDLLLCNCKAHSKEERTLQLLTSLFIFILLNYNLMKT